MSSNEFKGKMASDYQKVRRIVFPEYDAFQERVAERIARFEREGSPVSVLEIGVGTGETTKRVLDATKGIKIVGCDPEPGMLDQARENLREYLDAGRLELHQLDAKTMLENTIESGIPFDAIFSALTIHNIPKAARASIYPLLAPSLNPGGLFLNADKVVSDDPEKREAGHKEAIRRINRIDEIGRPDLKKGWLDHYNLDAKPEYQLRNAEIVEALRSNGFLEVTEEYREGTYGLYTAVRSKPQ